MENSQEPAAAMQRRSLAGFLDPLKALPDIRWEALGSFDANGESYSVPRFVFRGPNSSDPISIGLFAAIHGDEPAGALAAAAFLRQVSAEPQLAENFHLSIYPICNPTG